ncbi:MAG: N-acetyl-gamma-glutamyl-phosphate reductase [Acidimicrobiia bacterium]|nr:N-acetyl-gamma-glutamyl-phosphate reductase [Acidimicrobiia bacterium]
MSNSGLDSGSTSGWPLTDVPRLRVGIIGASGYTGAELMRLLAVHPSFNLEVATGDSMAGTAIAELYPSLAIAYRNRLFEPFSPELVEGLDVVFCGLPHGVSMGVVPEFIDDVGIVVDLGSDFRLKDPRLYPLWYGAEHSFPELLPEAAYGLPELFRSDIAEARLIAATGCNAAASTLTLAPLLASDLIEPDGIVINLITGVSGAGRPPKPNTTFCTVDENVTAYGLLTHRHIPEIEQALSISTGHDVSVLFTPHLVPTNRGILASCYGRPTQAATTDDVLEAMADYYRDEPFVIVDQRSPSTNAVTGSNAVHLTGRVDPRTGLVMAIGVLDNLMKGASGMAVQCANIATGLPETTGLSTIGVYP